jgi:hypothetical protein
MIEIRMDSRSIGDIAEELGLRVEASTRNNGIFSETFVSVTVPCGKGQVRFYGVLWTDTDHQAFDGTAPTVDSLAGVKYE